MQFLIYSTRNRFQYSPIGAGDIYEKKRGIFHPKFCYVYNDYFRYPFELFIF